MEILLYLTPIKRDKLSVLSQDIPKKSSKTLLISIGLAYL